MCSSIAARRSFGPSLRTQPGSWKCHTNVWPRIFWFASRARATISSAASNWNSPSDGSTTSHFISFSGVTVENCAAMSWR